MRRLVPVGAVRTAVGLMLTLAFSAGLPPQPTSAASRHPLRAAIESMPEYRDLDTDKGALVDYEALVRRLSPEAQAWLTQSGLFLEDGRLDWTERLILRKLVGKKHQLWYLTSPRMFDGASLADAMYCWLWRFPRDPAKSLVDTMRDIAAEPGSGVSPAAADRLSMLVRESATDNALALGLALVGNLGKPRAESFSYSTRAYNTQLAMLGMLLTDGDPLNALPARTPAGRAARRLTLAAAEVYGALLPCANDALAAELPHYARGIIDYQAGLAARGISDAPSTLSVPALLPLVWGAPSSAVPSYAVGDGIDSDAWFPRLEKRPMTLPEFRWSFASISLMQRVAHEVETKAGAAARLAELHDRLGTVTEKEAAKWTLTYMGKRFRGSHVGNPAYYWDRYKQGLVVPGDSLDKAETEVTVARALGVPALVGRLVVDKGLHSSYFAATCSDAGLCTSADSLDASRDDRGVEQMQVAFQKLPWDGFRFDNQYSGSMSRIVNVGKYELRVLTDGLPPGYLLRSRNPDLALEEY